jgi:hypothetical protein
MASVVRSPGTGTAVAIVVSSSLGIASTWCEYKARRFAPIERIEQLRGAQKITVLERGQLPGAVALVLVAACYHPGRLDCAVSCAGAAPCPDGLTCGADLLCHGGATECSALDAAVEPDGAGDGGAQPLAFCDPRNPGLLACFELEDRTTDGTANHFDLVTSGVTFDAGRVGRAALFLAASTARIPDDDRLDLQRFTVEAWVNQAQRSANNLSLVNNFFEYGLTLDLSGSPVCGYYDSGGMLHLVRGAPLPLATWVHLACTFDATRLQIYVDGVAGDSISGGGGVANSATVGVRVGGDGSMEGGDRFLGLLDQIRIFSVARSAAQLCADAGRPGCP